MAKRTRTLLAVDLEATCWSGDPPEGMRSEIIEIGICELDATTLEITRTESIMVKPQHSTISAFCAELTGITTADVQDAPTFPEAAELVLESFQSRELPWASWGDYDNAMISAMTALHGCQRPFSHRHLNAKLLYALARGQAKEIGLARAVRNLGLEFEGRNHSGIDDARAVAHVLQKVMGTARSAWAK